MPPRRSIFRTAGTLSVWTGAWLAMVIGSTPLEANPVDPQVIRGAVGFDDAVSGHLRIHQGSDRVVIDWGSFSIAPGEVTQFIQPGVRSAVLNRVRGNGASLLEGSLTANGNVFLLNPNGIVLGRSGRVDAAGFVASTLDVDNDAFWNGGDLEFRGESQAAVVNLGQIEAADGDVFLIGAAVRNEGFIRAPKGTVGLAAGNDVLLKAAGSGDERVFVRGASGKQKAVGVENRGVIEANQAELKAHGGNVYALAVRNEGRIAATGVTKTGGRILLRANGGRIESVGTMRARRSGGGGGGGGGTIRVDAGGGSESRVKISGGSLDASAEAGDGGKIEVTATQGDIGSGAELRADGAEGGNGGRVELIAEDRLVFDGVVSAQGSVSGGDGGFVELSGKNELFVQDLVRQVDVGAPAGRAGTLFLDPIDIAILDGTGGGVSGTSIFDGAIVDYLTSSGSLIIGTSSGSGGNGDITVGGAADISWNTGHDLTFLADRDFRMDPGAKIAASGAGDFTVTAKRGIVVGSGASVSTASGNLELSANQQAVPTTGTFDGVRIDGGTVESTGSGNVTVLGKGGSTGTSPGVRLLNAGKILGGTSGLVTITGTGNTVAAGNGVTLSGAGTRIGSAGANLTVNGTASGTNARGVFLGDGAGIGALGAGNVSVTGMGASAGEFSEGIFLNGAVSAVSVSSAGGNVALHGTGGGDGTGGNNQGVRIDGGGSSVFAGGAGTLEVTGFGGTSGTGNLNEGVTVVNASLGTAGGAVTVTGTGGGAGASTGNAGVRIGGATGAVTAGGLLTITGTGGANSGGLGVELTSPTGVSGDGVTLVADGIQLGSSTTVDAGTGVAALRPLTVGWAVDLGGSDVAGATLGLTDAELDRITAGLVQIGNGSTGQITVSNAITHGNHLALTTGAGASLQNAVTMAANRNFGLSAFGTVDGTLSVGAVLSATGTGTITLTTPRNIEFTTGSGASTGAGNLTLSANDSGTTSGLFQGVLVGNGVSIASGTGTISIIGRGGDTVNAGNHGIQIGNTATISSSGGDIFLTGQARGSAGANPTQEGLIVQGNITTGNDGNITLFGTGGNGTSGNLGVHLFGNVLVSTESGDLSITGVSGAGANSPGIQIADFGGPAPVQITSTSGKITLLGDGSAGSSPGINAFGSGVSIGGGTGAVDIEAVGDISFGAGAQIGTAGTGTVSLTASRGISLGTGVGVATADGNLSLFANQGVATPGNFVGIAIDGANVTSVDGSVLVAAIAGSDSAGAGQRGLWIRGGSLLEASGIGDVILSGSGGAGTDDNVGTEITGVGTVVRTASGRLYAEGWGAAEATGTGNDGVRIGPGAVFESLSGGNVELNGAAGGETGALAIRGDAGAGRIAGTGLMMVTTHGGDVNLGQKVEADDLLLRAQTEGAAFGLDASSNDVNTLAAGGDVALGSLRLRDANGFTVGTVGTANGVQAEGDVVLTGGGSGTVTVDQAIGSQSGGIEIAGWDLSVEAGVTTGEDSPGGIEFKAGRSFVLGSGIEVASGGSGGVGIEAGRSILFGSGSAIRTDGGGIFLEANALGSPWTGGFTGIELAGATVESSGGDVEFSGTGGADAGMSGQTGIRLGAGSRVETGDNGRVRLVGSGGTGAGGSIGVEILGPGTEIRTASGSLEITGTGATGAEGLGNHGVWIGSGAVVEATDGGNVELVGGAGGGDGSLAILGGGGTGRIAGTGLMMVTSQGGDVTLGQAVRADELLLRAQATGVGFDLIGEDNDVNTLAAGGDVALGSLDFRDTNGFTVGTVGTANGVQAEGDVTLRGGDSGTVTVAQAIGSGMGGIDIEGWDVAVEADVTTGEGSDGEITFQAGRSFELGAGVRIGPGGSGGVGIHAGRSILLGSGSSVVTEDGAIQLRANPGESSWAGGFTGIELAGATVETLGGDVDLEGRGGIDGEGEGQTGIRIGAGSRVESAGGWVTFTGTEAGSGDGAMAIRVDPLATLATDGDGQLILRSRGGDVNVGGQVRTGWLQLQDQTGADAASFRLWHPSNEIDVLTATGDGPLGAVGNLEVRDADDLVLGINFGEGGEGIDVAGELRVSAPDRLTVDWDTTAGGEIRMVSNDLRVQAPLTSTGNQVVGLVDDLGTGVGGTITVNAPVDGALGVRLGGGPGLGGDRFVINRPLAPGTTLSGNGGIDTVDFRGATDPVELDLGQITVESMERVLGSPQVDRVIGPTAGTSFVLSGADAFRWGTTNFSGFENLTGGPGDDVFAVATAGRISGTLDGGGGRNGVTYSGHLGPVAVDLGQGIATGIASFASIQAFHGSAQTRDVLTGTNADDLFTVLAANSGTVGSISFFSFENLRGGAGNDLFLFRNQATLAGAADGQEGSADTLVIDDSNLTGPQVYDITATTVSRNPTYRFAGMEGLVIVSGSGPDAFRTRFQPYTQFYSGGAGSDVLRIADASTTTSPVSRPPAGDVGFIGIEEIVAGAALGSDSGQILQTEAADVVFNQIGAGPVGGGGLGTTDNFNGGVTSGMTTFAAGIGAAALGSTVGGSAALPGVVGMLFASDRVTAQNSWNLSGAVALSGGAITVQGLEEIARQVSFNAELELNAAAGGQAKATAGQGDGAVAVSGDGAVDAGTGASLGQGMALEAEGELLGALGRNLVIEFGDGPVGLDDFGVPGDPGVLGGLTSQTNPAAFSGLSQAIGGDGTAPVGAGDGTVDLGLTGSGPGPGGTQALQANSDALTENELEGALNGL